MEPRCTNRHLICYSHSDIGLSSVIYSPHLKNKNTFRITSCSQIMYYELWIHLFFIVILKIQKFVGFMIFVCVSSKFKIWLTPSDFQFCIKFRNKVCNFFQIYLTIFSWHSCPFMHDIQNNSWKVSFSAKRQLTKLRRKRI